MGATHLILRCEDVEAGASFYRNVLALPVRQRNSGRADVDLGAVTATLTSADDRAGRHAGMVLEVEVPNVQQAVRELRRRGARVLIDAVLTEWGTESAFVAAPDGVVVEVFSRRVG